MTFREQTVIAPPPDTPAGFEELYEKNRLYCQKLLHIMTNYVIFAYVINVISLEYIVVTIY